MMSPNGNKVLFAESCLPSSEDGVKVGHAEVEVSEDGFWISVSTDADEGFAQMCPSVACKVYESLGRAITASNRARSRNGDGFVECAECRAKPGSPPLCAECLLRRDGPGPFPGRTGIRPTVLTSGTPIPRKIHVVCVNPENGHYMAYAEDAGNHGWGYSEEKAIVDLLEQLGIIAVTKAEPPQ